MEEITSDKTPESCGTEERKPEITVNLRQGWNSVVCINTTQVQARLIFRQGKLQKVEQTEVIQISK